MPCLIDLKHLQIHEHALFDRSEATYGCSDDKWVYVHVMLLSIYSEVMLARDLLLQGASVSK
jgi:hypothetical protein